MELFSILPSDLILCQGIPSCILDAKTFVQHVEKNMDLVHFPIGGGVGLGAAVTP